MNELTLEQCLQNIRNVLDTFKGTKAEHIALDQSYQKVWDTCLPKLQEIITLKNDDKS